MDPSKELLSRLLSRSGLESFRDKVKPGQFFSLPKNMDGRCSKFGSRSLLSGLSHRGGDAIKSASTQAVGETGGPALLGDLQDEDGLGGSRVQSSTFEQTSIGDTFTIAKWRSQMNHWT